MIAPPADEEPLVEQINYHSRHRSISTHQAHKPYPRYDLARGELERDHGHHERCTDLAPRPDLRRGYRHHGEGAKGDGEHEEEDVADVPVGEAGHHDADVQLGVRLARARRRASGLAVVGTVANKLPFVLFRLQLFALAQGS